LYLLLEEPFPYKHESVFTYIESVIYQHSNRFLTSTSSALRLTRAYLNDQLDLSSRQGEVLIINLDRRETEPSSAYLDAVLKPSQSKSSCIVSPCHPSPHHHFSMCRSSNSRYLVWECREKEEGKFVTGEKGETQGARLPTQGTPPPSPW
jgi:hypothetical protein